MDRFERFSFSIFEISRSWHKLAAEEMEKYGLKGPHAIYLTAINRHREGITAAQLADICCRDKGDVSRALVTLESKGLLERSGSHYRAQIQLTEAGKAAARAVYSRAAVAVEHASCGYSEEQREIFYQVLEKVTENLTALRKEGLPQA